MSQIYRRVRVVGRRLPLPVRRRVVSTIRSTRRTAGRIARSAASDRILEGYRRVLSPLRAEPIAEFQAQLPLELGSATSWCRVELEPYQRYRLLVTTDAAHDSDSNAGAISYRYVDRRGRVVRSGAVNKPDSPDLGYFDFIPRVPDGRRSEYVFFSPGEAAFVDLGFRTWKEDHVVLSAIEVDRLGRRTAVRKYDLDKSLVPRNPFRLGVVADEFTITALSLECDVLPVTLDGYRDELDEFAPDMVLIESAWNGNDGEWLYCVHRIRPEDDRLRGLISAARERGIPTLFWNKEDPAHFEDFIDAARECDFVATTDALLLDRYRAEVGHDRVFCLPFCVQPDIHNPRQPYDGREARIDAACFLGSWWAEKFDDRRSAQLALFEGSREYGLQIFDRYLTWSTHERYRLPPPWLEYTHGSLEYQAALSAYRMYRVVLNVNTVTNSPTMFSRRALEAAASGALIISNRSSGTEAALGELIDHVDTADECRKALAAIADDRQAADRRAHLAYRRVHTDHTWANRLDDVSRECGISIRRRRRPVISVVLATIRPEGANRILDYLSSVDQSTFELETIVVTGFDPALLEESASRLDRVILHQQDPSETLGDCLNWGADRASGEYFAKVDDDDLYGRNYFADLLLASTFSRADVVGKQSHLEWFESRDSTMLRYPNHEHRFTDFVCGSTLLVRASVFESVRFPRRRVGEDTVFLRRVSGLGMRTYSADRFGYVSMRRSDLNSHTWRATEDELLSGEQTAFYTRDVAHEDLEL